MRMSYTPDDQLLSESLEKTIEGINDFISAANNRIDNAKEWKQVHIVEIADLSARLQVLKAELVFLKEGVR
jgi:hypothetical protein